MQVSCHRPPRAQFGLQAGVGWGAVAETRLLVTEDDQIAVSRAPVSRTVSTSAATSESAVA